MPASGIGKYTAINKTNTSCPYGDSSPSSSLSLSPMMSQKSCCPPPWILVGKSYTAFFPYRLGKSPSTTDLRSSSRSWLTLSSSTSSLSPSLTISIFHHLSILCLSRRSFFYSSYPLPPEPHPTLLLSFPFSLSLAHLQLTS